MAQNDFVGESSQALSQFPLYPIDFKPRSFVEVIDEYEGEMVQKSDDSSLYP